MKGSLEVVIKGCIQRNRNSQTQLYRLFAPKMLGICLRYCSNREEAEELVQEGFYKVFKYIGNLKNIDATEGWIRKIIINTAVQRYIPKSALYPIVNLEDSGIDICDSDDLYSNFNVKDIIGMIQNLPNSYRIVFNLYVIDGYKHSEIATMLHISEGTSKSNLSVARSKLQKALTINPSLKISFR